MGAVNYTFETFFSLDKTLDYCEQACKDVNTISNARIAFLFSTMAFGVRGVEFGLKMLASVPCALIKIPFNIVYAIEVISNKNNSEWSGSLAEKMYTEFPGFSDVGFYAFKTYFCFISMLGMPVIGLIFPKDFSDEDAKLFFARPQSKKVPFIKPKKKQCLNPEDVDFRGIGNRVKNELLQNILYSLINSKIAKTYSVTQKPLVIHGPPKSGQKYLASLVVELLKQHIHKQVIFIKLNCRTASAEKTRKKISFFNKLITQGFFPVLYIKEFTSSQLNEYVKQADKLKGRGFFMFGSDSNEDLPERDCDLLKVGRPTRSERFDALAKFLEKYNSNIIDEDIELNDIAKLTKGFSIEDLQVLVDLSLPTSIK
jgi:hypothetical protein